MQIAPAVSAAFIQIWPARGIAARGEGPHVIKVDAVGGNEEVLDIRQVQREAKDGISVCTLLRLHRSAPCYSVNHHFRPGSPEEE